MEVSLWLRALLLLAALKILGGIAGFFVNAPPSSPFPPWVNLAQIAVFGSAAILLIFGGRSDTRALYLGSYFFLFASAFADRLLIRLSFVLNPPLATFATGPAALRIDAFLPYLMWLFFRDFPKGVPAGLADRLCRFALRTSLWVGIALFVANALDLKQVARSGPGWASFLSQHHWTIVILLTLPVLPFAIWRARHARLNEKRRVGIFIAGLLLGSVPMLVDVLLEALNPSFREFMDANRVWAGAIVYPLLLSIPITTAYSVLVHRVLDVHLIIRKALQHALARSTVLAIAVIPFLGLVWYLYDHRDETIAHLLSGARPLGYLVATAIGLATLRLRHRVLNSIDRRFFREEYDSRQILAGLVERSRLTTGTHELTRLLSGEINRALHLKSMAVLIADSSGNRFISLDREVPPLDASFALSALIGGNSEPLDVELEDPKSPLRRLPEGERQWLAEGAVRLIVPLIASNGSLVGLIALGEKMSELPFTGEDRLLLATIAAAGALTLENRLMRASIASPDPAPAGSTISLEQFAAQQDSSLATECQVCHTLQAPRNLICAACSGRVVLVPVPYVLLEKFRLEKRIGSGGMGIVYRARDIQLGRAVALKFLPPEKSTSPRARARFLREAQAASALDHANIGAIYEIGEWNQQLFIAMAHYEGSTLKDRIQQGPMDFRETEAVLAQIAAGLAAAHVAGIVHRDLKSANVILTPGGQAKILDFGLAKLKQEDLDETPLTEDGTLIGTIGYISPEQIQSKEVDRRSDLWSLGVVAYEMLTGILPFEAASRTEICRLILHTDPRPLPELRDGIPQTLIHLVERLLVKEPEARMQSADEVLRALSTRQASR